MSRYLTKCVKFFWIKMYRFNHFNVYFFVIYIIYIYISRSIRAVKRETINKQFRLNSFEGSNLFLVNNFWLNNFEDLAISLLNKKERPNNFLNKKERLNNWNLIISLPNKKGKLNNFIGLAISLLNKKERPYNFLT